MNERTKQLKDLIDCQYKLLDAYALLTLSVAINFVILIIFFTQG